MDEGPLMSGWDQQHDIESLEHDLRWRRADLGEMPERGQIITLVRFPADPKDTSLKVYERMRVEVIFTDPVKIMGPGLPFEDGRRVELPKRPEGGRAGGLEMILWRERA